MNLNLIEMEIGWVIGVFIWAATITLATGTYAIIQHLRHQKEIKRDLEQIKRLNEERDSLG